MYPYPGSVILYNLDKYYQMSRSDRTIHFFMLDGSSFMKALSALLSASDPRVRSAPQVSGFRGTLELVEYGVQLVDPPCDIQLHAACHGGISLVSQGGGVSLNRVKSYGFSFWQISYFKFLVWLYFIQYLVFFLTVRLTTGGGRGFEFGLATPCIDRISEKD